MNPANPFAAADFVELLPPASQTTTPVKGSGVATAHYDGEAYLVLDAGAATAGSSPKMVVKLQTAVDDVDGHYDDFATSVVAADVTDVAGTAGVQKIPFDIGDSKGYVRAVATLTGSSTPTFLRSALLVARKKYSDQS